MPKVGAQWFTRGGDEEIGIFWVSGQNFSFNLSKHITLDFTQPAVSARAVTVQ